MAEDCFKAAEGSGWWHGVAPTHDSKYIRIGSRCEERLSKTDFISFATLHDSVVVVGRCTIDVTWTFILKT